MQEQHMQVRPWVDAPLRSSSHRGGPVRPLERSATGRPASALARHLLARDERWQKTYYGADRSNVLRFAESKGRAQPVIFFHGVGGPFDPNFSASQNG
jgi:hypothetical protein